MDKIYALLIVLILSASLPALVYAQDSSTPSATPSELTFEENERIQNRRVEKKQEIAQRIGENLNKLNQKASDKFKERANHLTNLLNKIESRINKIEANGKNMQDAKNKAVTIKSSLNDFATRIDQQRAKTYTVNLNDANLRQSVGQSHQQLRKDLKALHASLVEIRKTIGDLLKTNLASPSASQ